MYWFDMSKEMDLNNFERVSFIGEGNSAETVQYKDQQTQEKYCVKIFKRSFIRKHGNSIFIREVSLLSRIDNPAVLTLHGFNINSQIVDSPIIITKYYPKSLSSYLYEDKIPSSKKYIIILGIAEGMKYLHSIDISHRDLKPDNILLDENHHPVIGDLGQSRLGSQGMKTYGGTLDHMAPEISEGDYSNKVDVFSFAITFYEIYTQGPAYNIPTDNIDFFGRVKEGFRPDDEVFTSNLIKRFVNDCWAADPDQRPTFQNIVETIRSDEFREAMQANDREVTDYLMSFNRHRDPAIIKQKADEGNINKAIEYADMLRTGEDVENIDEDGAMHYYRIAAERNNTYGMQQYAQLLIKKGRRDEASDYLKRAIRMGDSDALQIFIDEKFDQINQNEITELFRNCADTGNPDAMYYYGVMLYNGDNIDQDKRNAFRYFKNAADLGNVAAHGYTARMLEEGDGIERNPARAAYYFNQGIRFNDANTILFHAISMLNDDYSEINTNEITTSFKRSADLGCQAAMLFYATILLHGYLGVECSQAISNDYIRKAETVDSKEDASLTLDLAFRIYENKIKIFQKKDSELLFNVSLPIYVKFLQKDKALEVLKKASETGNEVSRKMYCEKKGLFYEMFYNFEPKRLKYSIDEIRHAVVIIKAACSNENKAKMIANLKKNGVNNIDELIREIKNAFNFVYAKSPNYTAINERFNEILIKKIFDGKLMDSDFA